MMAEMMLEPRIAAIAARKRITADDVLYLRRSVYQDGMSSRGEVENLFALDGACQDKAPEWAAFLIEAACDYAVHQEKPEGHLSDANASWLQGLIVRDGRVDRATELELMVKVLETARTAPAAFADFVLAQTQSAVCDPHGALASLDANSMMRISREAAAVVRRVLYAMGGHSNVAVTKAEAEMMFNLNDRASQAQNDPEWNELFVKAIANFMMATSGYKVQSREKALAQETFLNAPSAGFASSLGGFLSRMVTGSLSDRQDWRDGRSVEGRFAERNAAFDAEAANAERITLEEAAWLAERINNDGQMGANERALVEFLRAESPALHPAFQKILANAA
jgi:hypothetical protein